MSLMIVLLTGIIMSSAPALSTGEYETETRVDVGPSSTLMTWECPDMVETISSDGYAGYIASGCGLSGPSGDVLLPASDLFFAVPPGSDPVLEVIPEGVHYFGDGRILRTAPSPGGIDLYFPAPSRDLPGAWGTIVDSGTYRRAGYVQVRLHPAIYSGEDDALYSADRLLVRLDYSGTVEPGPDRGVTGWIFDVLFEGGNSVWTVPRGSRGHSPFWGLPWYSLGIDTAGIYRVSCQDIPQAQGTPSSTLALYCGRGREMGSEPWTTMFYPRPVPILVDDGGDGTFDPGDSFYFFGRGLSWWEPQDEQMPEHFNHPYDDVNRYWITWGGEDGLRMDVQNGQLSGAPSIPDDFLTRQHHEQNIVRSLGYTDFPDDWAWICSDASTDTWHYFDFDAPSAAGSGMVRISLQSTKTQRHRIKLFLNSVEVCDTSWTGIGLLDLTLTVDGIEDSGNDLDLQIIRDIGEDIIYVDWFEVFPWTENSLTGQSHVPMEWWPEYYRQEFTWGSEIGDDLVFLVSADTLAENIDVPQGNSFEFQIPAEWEARELWIVQNDQAYSPAEIQPESPGRILETLSSARSVYVSADEFSDDVDPMVSSSDDALLILTSEVYDEFNGGIKDPGAIRAMVSWMVKSWAEIPENLILVGGGNWDPRNFISSKVSYIDVICDENTSIVMDDLFSVVEGSLLPQVAVARIAVVNRNDLQLLVDRTISYRENEDPGQWQTVVIGAADDERSPINSNDERYHTQGVERLLTEHLPDFVKPEKLYMIFYDWNSIWSKPEARADYIDLWREGALISLFLGHGSFDQLADEGLFFLEDVGLLDCGPRLPLALFGSCDVGRFQNPSSECIGQQVTISPVGGAILGLAASDKTSGPVNEVYFSFILDILFQRMFQQADVPMGMCITLAKIKAGYGANNAQYILFGDGSLPIAFPWDSLTISSDTALAGQLNTVTGTAPENGLVMIEAYESCEPDTYYTFRQSLPIGYLTIPGIYYSGTACALPDFTADMFIPVDSDTGRLARIQYTFLSEGTIAASSTYPQVMLMGDPPHDTTGPEIQLWIDGYRNQTDPEVSGPVVAQAVLSDSSGINLLGNTGRQLALYTDGTPQDVSCYFEYDRGSSTTGGLTVEIGALEPGDHNLELRAADGLLNISQVEIDFSVTQDNSFGIFDVFPYPNPSSDGTSINWTQTSPGRVDISIYTVAGRRIARFGNIEGEAGYNQHWWDGRDADGDMVASGAYILHISASSIADAGEESETTCIIAVVRDP